MFTRAVAAVSSAAVILSGLMATTPALAAPTTAADLPALLTVSAPDSTHRYDRDAFRHWVDSDGDGCNTRYEVLIEESTTPPTVTPPCTLSGGTWVSPYDGFATSDVTQVQIDHVVALAEAWRSGAWAWTSQKREEFANDLGVPYALTAASNTSNQAKADLDPARWMPANTAYSCEYVTSWALIKYRWSLTVDSAELAALRNTLQGECGATPVALPSVMVARTPTTPEPTQPPATTATFPAGVTRLQGVSRYETAMAVSKRYSPGVPAVFVATGQNFPDALSAAAAAAHLGAPLLLTPTASLPASVRSEIVRLAPKRIYIAGGVGVVSSAIEKDLRKISSNVKRLGGQSRYETGERVVRTAFASASHVFVATGRGFPDALAASGAAGAEAAPVVLVDGALGGLTPAAQKLLSDLHPSSVTVVGGTGAVSAGIERQLAARYATKRMGGSDRYATAARINDSFFAPGSGPAAFLATGLNFPDALAGAALAGKMKSPVYVTAQACVPESVHRSMRSLGAPATVALGSAAVVSNAAAANIGCLTASTPTISGTTRVGSSLTARPGSWTAGTSFAYQWLANGSSIGGATGATLALTSAMVGKQISVRVTGSQSGYATKSVTSAKTAKVAYPGRTAPIDSWNCPSWAPIKGNRGTNGWIYHVPGGAYYSRTNPEECFRTEADARAAGYRRSKL